MWRATRILLAAVVAFSWSAARAGQAAPPLVVADLNGHPINLGALRGKVVIVNFFASWCPPCRQEMPALASFYRHYHDRGVEVIGLSTDRERDRDDVVAIARPLGYPVAMARDATENGFGMPRVLPVAYLIDAHGVLRGEISENGTPLTEESLAAAVRSLLPAVPRASQ